jgi:quercetin dioxygenase-like cupin family protein
VYQQVDYKCRTLAYIVPKAPLPNKTTFITSDEVGQQVGYIVYPAGGEVPRHFHNPVKRELTGTTEVLLILKGKCYVDFYDDDKTLIASRELKEGDLIIIVAGGHGFRMEEDTVMLEVKQGPYSGVAEKERF